MDGHCGHGQHAPTEKHYIHAPTIHSIIDATVMWRKLVSHRPPLPLPHGAAKLHMVGAHAVLVPVSFRAASLDHEGLFVAQPRLGAATASAADAAPVVPLEELSAISLTQEVLPLAQDQVGAVVLGLLLGAASAHVPPVLFWAEAPHDAAVVGHRDGATAGAAELGKGVRVFQACTPVTASWVLGAGRLPVSSDSADAATPRFVHELRAALLPTAADSARRWSHVRQLMVRRIGAIGAPRTGSAAPIPHISHQKPMARHQQQTTLAVYGVPTPSYDDTPSPSTPSTATSSTCHPLLLIQQQAELLQLHVLPDYLLLPELQLLEFLEVEVHLFAHYAGTVTSQALPLPGHALAFLAVVIQEAAQVPQLAVVLLELLIYVLIGTEGRNESK